MSFLLLSRSIGAAPTVRRGLLLQVLRKAALFSHWTLRLEGYLHGDPGLVLHLEKVPLSFLLCIAESVLFYLEKVGLWTQVYYWLERAKMYCSLSHWVKNLHA